MSNKNIANYTTFNSLLVNYLEIQSASTGLIIYNQDPTVPSFSVDAATQTVNMSGTLNVTGSASFETITVSEFAGGMQSLATNNPANLLDLGINANYNDGTSKYTGIIKDVSDSLQRWTFFKDITTQPTTTVETIDSTKLDSVRMNKLYVNDGSVSAPSITFHNDTGTNTGFYLAAQDEIGMTAGGLKIAGVRYVSGSSTEFQLDSTTALKLKKIDTIDDVASVTAPSINTGHVYMKGASASDKWFKFYSYTDAATPSYTGAVFTSPTNNYFLLNTGTDLEIVKTTTVTSDTSSPDYRDATKTQILIINSSSIETKAKLIIPVGGVSAPGLSFSQESTTGIFKSGANALGIVSNNYNILNVSDSLITAYKAISNINGLVTAPSFSFTSNSGTGMWRNNAASYENVSFSANGTSLGYFWLRTTPQWITGSSGSAAIPSIAWSNDIYTGLFSPTNEAASGQLSISLNTAEIARFRGRTGTGSGNIELYNSLMLTPNGTKQNFYASATDIRAITTFKTNEAWFQAYNLIDSNPVFLFTFRSAGAIGKDYSNNGYDAVAVGSPIAAALVKDSNSVIKRDALDLTTNTTKYLNLTSRLAALTNLDNTSISFWFKISGALSTDNTIFSCYKTTGTKEISIKILSDAASRPNALQVTVQSDSLTTLQYHTATASDVGTPSPISVKDGLWHHVVIHLGSGVGSSNPKHFMYYDGAELNVAGNTIYVTSHGDNSGNPEASTNSFNDLSFNYASIGAFYNGGSGSLFYTGYLKDFYMTGRIISDAEITALYTEPYVYTYGLDVAVINASQINSLSSTYFANGSAAAPSISFSSTPNLGIYRSANNVLGISTSGTERITIADSLLQFNSGSGSDNFEIDGGTNYWLKLKMSPTGSTGPRVVFQHPTADSRHYIQSAHDSTTIANNFMDFYLYDVSGGVDAYGLGTNKILRVGQTAAGSNTGLLTIYGIARVYNGTPSVPAYSFSNSTGLGLYRITDNDLGISAGGTLRLEVNTVVTVGNAFDDAITRLYVPLGSDVLPSIGFIGDTNSGIYSSAADNIDISCGGSNVLNINSTAITSQSQIIADLNNTKALLIRKDGNAGDIFVVDTTNSRVHLGHTNYFLSRATPSALTESFRFNTSASNSTTFGLEVLNQNYTGSSICAAVYVGRDYAHANNNMRIQFTYAGNDNSANSFGLGTTSKDYINVVMSTNTTTINSNLSVVNTASFSDQLKAANGSASLPAYTFTNATAAAGMYLLVDNTTLGFAAGASSIMQLTSSDITALAIFKFDAGNAAAPGLVVSSSTTTGLYSITSNVLGISNNGASTWLFNPSTSPHECLNEIYFKPNGSIRTYITDKKLRASSNQTILEQAPFIHFKFLTDPNTNTTKQDKSALGSAISINGSITYSTNTINLTDVDGLGLLNMSAVVLPGDTTAYIQTTSSLTDILKLSTFDLHIKVKLDTNASLGSIVYIAGNSANTNNYLLIRHDTTASSWNLVIRVNGSSFVSLTGNTTLSSNRWYDLNFSFGNSNITVYVNGVADTSIANSVFNFNSFTDTSAILFKLGSNAVTARNTNCYIHEVYIQATSTTETSSGTYRVQAHEVYTNKLQIADVSGLVEEGYLLRSDKGNNAIWDNSIQLYPGYIQLNNSKVMRAPNGSATAPTYAFSSANNGMYLSGTNTLGFTTNGTQKISLSTSLMNIDSSIQTTINNTTVPTSSTTGALVITGGIGLGNGSATPSRINFGSAYTTTGTTASKLISLRDIVDNQHQFLGFGMNDNQLRYQVNNTTTDHAFYAATSSSASNEVFRIKGTGVLYAQDGLYSAPSYSFLNSPGSGIFRTGTSNNIGISTSGVKRIDISDATTNLTNEIQLNSGFRRSVTTVSTASLILDLTHNIVILSYATDSSDVVVTLPAASTNIGREYTLIKTGAGGGNLVINTASGSDFIDDAATTQIILPNQYDRISLICGQSNRWFSV